MKHTFFIPVMCGLIVGCNPAGKPDIGVLVPDEPAARSPDVDKRLAKLELQIQLLGDAIYPVFGDQPPRDRIGDIDGRLQAVERAKLTRATPSLLELQEHVHALDMKVFPPPSPVSPITKP